MIFATRKNFLRKKRKTKKFLIHKHKNILRKLDDYKYNFSNFFQPFCSKKGTQF